MIKNMEINPGGELADSRRLKVGTFFFLSFQYAKGKTFRS